MVFAATSFGAMAYSAKLASKQLSGPEIAFFRMAVGLHFAEDMLQAAVGTDQKSGAFYAFYQLAVHVFVFDNVVIFAGFLVRIG